MSVQAPLVLIVDDNEMNRDMLARRLERQGCQAITAEDGIQALEILPQHSFDLILLDIMMPRMTGYEVLDRVKNEPTTRHIPVIMISAVDDLESVVKCVEKGADDYLFKPFNPILLKARIGASLEKKRLRDQEQVLLRQVQAGPAGQNKALVQKFFDDLTNGQNEYALLSPDSSFVESGNVQFSVEKLRKAFSGVNLQIRDMIAESDKVVTQLVLYPVNVSIVVISSISQDKITSQQFFASQPEWLRQRLL
jgi:CheY-like chemotaxis protein